MSLIKYLWNKRNKRHGSLDPTINYITIHLNPVIVIDLMQDKQDVNDIGIRSSKSELSSCRSDNRDE